MQKRSDGKFDLFRDTTACSPLMAILFGGQLESQRSVVTIDKWLPIFVKGPYGTVDTVLQFRDALETLLTSTFQSLAKHKSGSEDCGDNVPAKYLADDMVLEPFAAGLVDLLDQDNGRRMSAAPQGLFRCF